MINTLTQQKLESIVWVAANILRGNMGTSGYKGYFSSMLHPVLRAPISPLRGSSEVCYRQLLLSGKERGTGPGAGR